MAAHMRTAAARLFSNSFIRLNGCQQSRSLAKELGGILETYKERPKERQEDLFENPLLKPKLKEIIVDDIEKILAAQPPTEDNDMPLSTLPNPYQKPAKRCILCVHDVELDYKNTRLLSQFVSPHTGQIYGRHITGLCIYMQRRVAKLIIRARFFGFMPYMMKESAFLKDPKLYDPFKRQS